MRAIALGITREFPNGVRNARTTPRILRTLAAIDREISRFEERQSAKATLMGRQTPADSPSMIRFIIVSETRYQGGLI